MRRPALAAVVVVSVSAVLLAGCTATTDRPDADAGAAWKGSGGGGSDPIADGVAFDEELPDGVTVEWTDTMFGDPDFTIDSPDDGNGHWSYLQVSTGCRISFWQSSASGVGTPGDEVTRSDQTIATWLDFDLAEMQEYAFSTPLSIAGVDGATFDAQAVVGSGDQDDWITAARAFDGSDQLLAVDVTCPAGTSGEDTLNGLMPDYIAARVS